MGFVQTVSGVGTSAGPSWSTFNGKEVVLCWKGEGNDSGIYFTKAAGLQPAPNVTTGQYSFPAQQKIPNVGTSAAPAIANLGKTLYLFFKGESDTTINWATSSDGATWENVQPLSFGNNVNAQTSHAPTVVSANNELYLFWKGGSDSTIWWSTFSNGHWTPQLKVSPATGGTPETSVSPAVAVQGASVHLLYKGNTSNNIFWTSFSNGKWSPQQQLFAGNDIGGTAGAPSLVCDGNGVVWLTWVCPTGDPGGVLILNGLYFASLLSNGSWSAPSLQQNGVVPGFAPALMSTGATAQDIMMAWRNPGSDNNIYYGPLRLPNTSYVFQIPRYECLTTRSGELIGTAADTDFLSLSIQLSTSTSPVTSTVGNVNDPGSGGVYMTAGQFSTGTSVTVSVPDNAQVVMSYVIYNSSLPSSQAIQLASKGAESLVSAGASAAATAAGGAIGAAIGAAIGTGVVPLIGSAIGALAGWLVSEGWGFAFPNCDGPCAAAVHVFPASYLLAGVVTPTMDQNPAPGGPSITSQSGCGASPVYDVYWQVNRASS